MLQESLRFCKEILHLHLRPWLCDENSINFENLLVNLKSISLDFIPEYEVSLDNPLTAKMIFYERIIDNGCKEYLNVIHEDLQDATSENEKPFIVMDALNNAIAGYLSDCASVIRLRKEYQAKPDELEILSMLKHYLVWIYLEVQDRNEGYLVNPPLRLDEIYLKFLGEKEPYPSVIIGAILSPEMKFKQPIEVQSELEFQVIQKDFRPNDKTHYTYQQLIKDPGRFSKLEERLYEEGLIDELYNFRNQYGNHQYLAAVFHQLLERGYFHRRIFPENIEVKALDVVNFLNHRYNADVKKQFRTWSGTPQKLQEFIETKYWLEHLA